MEIEKKEQISSFLDKIIGLFLIIVVLTIPFPKYIQTIETLCFIILILAFTVKLVLSKSEDIDERENRISSNGIIGTRIDLPILIFTILIVVSIFFSVDYSYSLHEFRKYWLRPVLLSYFIVNFAVNKRNIRYIVWAVVISALTPIILGIIQYFTEVIRIKSLFGAPTEFGQYLDYIIPFIFAMVLWNREKISKIVLSLILLGAFFCLIFTYTRASWVSVFIAMLFLCFIKNKKNILISVALIFLLLIFSPHSIKNRIISISNRQNYLHRIYLMENTIEQIKKRPFTGYGWGYHNFHDLYPSFISPELKTLAEGNSEWLDIHHAHNYLLEIAFETGVLGLAVFLWLWIAIMILTCKNFIKLREPFLKSIAVGIFAAFIACSIHWLVEIPDAKQLIMILWTFIGISMAILNITDEKWEKKNI